MIDTKIQCTILVRAVKQKCKSQEQGERLRKNLLLDLKLESCATGKYISMYPRVLQKYSDFFRIPPDFDSHYRI